MKRKMRSVRKPAMKDHKDSRMKKLKLLNSWQYRIDVHLDMLGNSVRDKTDAAVKNIPVRACGLMKKAVVYAIALTIGFMVVNAVVEERSTSGGSNAYAGEVEQQEAALYRTRAELLFAIRGAKHLGTKMKDMVERIPGEETRIDGYKIGNMQIVTFTYKNQIYGYGTKINGVNQYYSDTDNTGIFTPSHGHDVHFEEY